MALLLRCSHALAAAAAALDPEAFAAAAAVADRETRKLGGAVSVILEVNKDDGQTMLLPNPHRVNLYLLTLLPPLPLSCGTLRRRMIICDGQRCSQPAAKITNRFP